MSLPPKSYLNFPELSEELGVTSKIMRDYVFEQCLIRPAIRQSANPLKTGLKISYVDFGAQSTIKDGSVDLPIGEEWIYLDLTNIHRRMIETTVPYQNGNTRAVITGRTSKATKELYGPVELQNLDGSFIEHDFKYPNVDRFEKTLLTRFIAEDDFAISDVKLEDDNGLLGIWIDLNIDPLDLIFPRAEIVRFVTATSDLKINQALVTGGVVSSGEVERIPYNEDRDRLLHNRLILIGCMRKLDAKPLPDGRPFISTMEGLGLTAGGPGDMKQLDHLAFEVKNVESLYEKLKATGAHFPRGELGPGPYGKAIYVSDPDGNELELFEFER